MPRLISDGERMGPVVGSLQKSAIKLPEVLCEGHDSEVVQPKTETPAAESVVLLCEFLEVLEEGLGPEGGCVL